MAFFFRKKAPLSVLKVFLQSGNQLLLKPDAVKSERRFVFAKQRTMTLIFITKKNRTTLIRNIKNIT